MKPILITLFITLLHIGCIAQPIGADCNPKLNDAEALLCNKLFSHTGFDFKGKTIMYVTNIGEDKTYSAQYLPATKKDFFRYSRQTTDTLLKYHLVVLNAIQKNETPDIDAVVFFMTPNFNKDFKGSWVDKSIKHFKGIKLNFPDNIDLAGNDTTENITIEDAKFLNSIFRFERYSFDFTNKKIAIVVKHNDSYAMLYKHDYMQYLKTHLKTHFSIPTDWLYVLNSINKASTGYDAVIVEYAKHVDFENVLQLITTFKPTISNK